MYAKFFRIASVTLFGIFIAIRMFVENNVIKDISLLSAIVIFLALSAGGLLFDKTCPSEDRKAYRKFTIGFAAVLLIFGVMLLLRYAIL